MKDQFQNKKQGILHLVLAVSWLILGIWEIADDGHSVRAWIYIVTAIAWLVISIYNMNYKKKE